VRTLLTNATLIDCIKPKPLEHASVLSKDGRIREIRTQAAPPPEAGDATVIELAGGWLMPGLRDVHIQPDFLVSDKRRDA
jgi:cytosine/adenosine deaminase-related metal-dependent hydrolase